MPRLTIIGSSHVSAFKEGWDAIASDHPDWDVRFFAVKASWFRDLVLSPDLSLGLSPTAARENPKLRQFVLKINRALSTDLAVADIVLWAGFRLPFQRLVAWLERRDVAGLTIRGGLPVVSRDRFDAACDKIAATLLPPADWLGWDRPRLVLHPSPPPSETCLSDARERFRPWSAFASRPQGQRAAIDGFLARYEAVLAKHRLALLRPPQEALMDSGVAAARFAAGSNRLIGDARPQDDHEHMNADYGRLALTAFFATLGPALAAEAAAAPATARRASAVPKPQRRARDRRERPGGSVRSTAGAAASPYLDLPARAYWRSGVAERAPLDPGDLYRPRFAISREMRIATAGSCFAQHVGRALRGAGFNVLDAEPPPASVPDADAARFGYRLFSGRFGNIYTARQLAQLLDEAEGRIAPAQPVWRRGDRCFDAQRPGVEPGGLASEAEVLADRERHLARLRPMVREADVFVFTFGLTEAWIHRASGTVYPTAPGTIAGGFDPEVFAFRNFDALEVLADFEAFRAALKAINPGVRFLVTVSPVPLTATATGDHVEVATCYSKATLRAVCGMLVARHADVDYFPSFEIITSQNARGVYYESNLRNVSPMGVETAMRLFLRAHGADAAQPAPPRPDASLARDATGDPCEDALLEAFAR